MRLLVSPSQLLQFSHQTDRGLLAALRGGWW